MVCATTVTHNWWCTSAGVCAQDCAVQTSRRQQKSLTIWTTIWNENHTLHALLPDRRPNLTYELRPRFHDRELAVSVKLSCLTENNFLIRQLYKNCY